MAKLDIKLTKKEDALIRLVGKTGFYVSEYKNKLGISAWIVNSLVDKGLLEKERGLFFFTKFLTPYCLTNKGREYVKNQLMFNPYRFRAPQANHDFILGNIYLSLDERDRESWVTETKLGLDYPDYSVTDGMFVNKCGEKVAVEVITSNYTEDTLAAKQIFIDRFCDKSVVVDADKY